MGSLKIRFPISFTSDIGFIPKYLRLNYMVTPLPKKSFDILNKYFTINLIDEECSDSSLLFPKLLTKTTTNFV